LPSFVRQKAEGRKVANALPPHVGLLRKLEEPKREDEKNKVEFGGAFFSAKLATIQPPHSPCISPQIHHQNTTFCTPILLKPAAKTHIHQRRKNGTKSPPVRATFAGQNVNRPGSLPAYSFD
jgi:hypothetical protein